MSKSREQLIDWLKTINIENKTVLDVGAGDKPARNFVKGTPKEYTTCDIDPEFNCDFLIDLNSLYPTEHPIFRKQYDMVFCLETLEHIWNPVQAVKNLFRLTTEGGTLFISTPFINPIHDKWDYFRFTFQWFNKVLPEVGFTSVTVETRIATSQEELYNFYLLEGQRMSKITLQKFGHKHLYDLGYMVEAKRC